MSNSGLSAKNEAIREVAFGSITSSLTNVGSALTHDASMVTIMNNTNADIYIGIDGIVARKLASKTGRVFDFKTNDMYRKAGTQYAVKDDGVTSATSGSVWIEVDYT